MRLSSCLIAVNDLINYMYTFIKATNSHYQNVCDHSRNFALANFKLEEVVRNVWENF
jgi:hypothetical protein